MNCQALKSRSTESKVVHSVSRFVGFKHFVPVAISVAFPVLLYRVMWSVKWGQCVLKQDQTVRRENTSKCALFGFV
jgi:hypothetical protein